MMMMSYNTHLSVSNNKKKKKKKKKNSLIIEQIRRVSIFSPKSGLSFLFIFYYFYFYFYFYFILFVTHCLAVRKNKN